MFEKKNICCSIYWKQRDLGLYMSCMYWIL